MRIRLSLICSALAIAALATPSFAVKKGPPAKPAATAPAAQSSGKPNELTLGEAYSLLSLDRMTSPSPADKTLASGAVEQLKGIAHALDKRPTGAKFEPALPFINYNPQQTLGQIQAIVQGGAAPQAIASARYQLLLCSGCHAAGAKPQWTKIQPAPNLSLIEFGDFYNYLGRESDALLYYEKILSSKGLSSSQPETWLRAATHLIALSIATSDSPYTYVDTLSYILQETQISKSQRALVMQWRSIGKAWGGERLVPSKPAELLQHVMSLTAMADGNNRAQQWTGLVYQSRAMAELRKVQLMGTTDQKAKAFFMAAELREKLAGINGVWLQPQGYYEACIRVAPRTPDANRCFTQLSSLSQRDPKFVLEASTNQELQALLK